jgi:predicted acyltransferase
MRGLVMIFLGGESCRLYQSLRDLGTAELYKDAIDFLFEHHPWHGLHMWDLIQPAFMLMAGSSLYLSWHFKSLKGVTWEQNLRHVLIRCLKLFLLGTGIHCINSGRLVWELWNVLTQLSFTTLVAYLIIRETMRLQLIVSLLLIVLTEILYRYTNIPGYDMPFVIGRNFGSWMDMVLMQKVNKYGWVTINCIPTAAHTIWGVMAARLIVGPGTPSDKISKVVTAGIIGLILGYGLDLSGATPIIKRICTSSFIFVSAGWVLLALALLYWITDVKKIRKYAWICVMVGMNAIFIYVVYETVGHLWLNGVVAIFVKGFTEILQTPELIQNLLSALVTFFLELYFCYWLYKRKVYIKI